MTATVAPLPPCRRELGTYDQGRAGPTLLVLAGIHGNEPAGVLGAQRVLAQLQEREPEMKGRLIVLAGNLPALREGVRYLARDLNRGWMETQVAALQQQAVAADSPEDGQQRELLGHFERALATARGPLVFVDLHTSSADGPPFVCLADTTDNRRLAQTTTVPIILGIEELIDGASLEWFGARGLVAFAVEGGRSEHPDTVGNHEAVLWLLLQSLGMLAASATDTAPHRAHLQKSTAGLPSLVEIFHRRAITAADRFVMAPGFTNFKPVQKGMLLAHDCRGEIRAEQDCRMMLPLYQAQGDDGYFLARPVRPFWLSLAAILRRLKLYRCVHWFPGIRRDPDDKRTILVDPGIARWLVTEVFHLLGFRKQRRRGDKLAFTRRWSLPDNRRLG